ncbi:DUF262 domain-containing protein [Emticicia sp. 17c]|uniref:DUF262 domain-containing protein n=1 Tax=Emticicia sp. 17c TaxID=3127704 RepID=UPI00301B8D58
MGQFKDLSIKDVIQEINQSYFLPDIQREYVWLKKAEEKKIEQLFDSVLRGYPISSFLFWKLKKTDIETNRENREEQDTNKLNFQLYKFLEKYDEREVHNIKIDIEQVNSNDLYIVLDGQQRLTSLYIGLKGSRTLKRKKSWADNPNAYEEKKLYLNLKHTPNFENPEDNYDFQFLKYEESLVKNDSQFWFKVGNILDRKVGDIYSYITENNLSGQEATILTELMDVFCTQKQISYFEETEKSLDKVLKIFIRVNSGGTQLSYSDLLMSILTANFSSDIRALMNRLVDSLKDEGFGVMERDQILKTCLILTECPHIFALRNFSKANIHKIEDNWEEITNQIYSAIDILKEFGYRNRLTSAYIISVIAFYLFKHKNISEEDKNEMLKFVRLAQIKSYFSSSLDTKLEIVSKAIKNNSTFKGVNVELLNNQTYPLFLSEDDIERMVDLQYGSLALLPVLQILYPHLDYKNSSFHIDHIYPKSKFNDKNLLLDKNYMGKANYLYNLQLLQGEENNTKRAKDPELWMAEELSADKIEEYKIRNYIKQDLKLEWQNIADFDKYRSEKLVIELKRLLLNKEVQALTEV